MQEGSKREEDIIKKINSSTFQQSRGDASSNPVKTRIRRQILKDLGFLQEGEQEVEDELIANDKCLDLYLQIRLERERKQIESLRESNLDRLNTIIDKCLQSDKFTKDSLWKILDLIYKPLPSGSSASSSQQQQEQQQEQRPAQPTVALSPDARKRKLASPVVSPKGHKRFASDVPSLGTVAATQPPYYGAPIQSGPTPWVGQQYNQQAPPQHQQQYEFKNTIPAGLGGPARHPHQETIQTTPISENQPPTAAMAQQQQYFAGHYSPAQFVANGARGGYFLPAATATAAAQSGRPHPVVMMQSDSPTQRAPSGYLQPPQHIPSSYGSTIKQEYPMTTRRLQGHRRSQSANVPTFGIGSTKSPSRELHATPQKPVNFLIHTPKHPPPG
ncbi:ZYRO0A01452p [Zygosaccharomyces rouxii]|uniref:ZYRO0A01452p n=1 Tax=Zygosaccharomyces rouxii (strain ATCC 2623 / CBS 732 / NBRC 1130 / NCYC 568 / NRRL Y-229) TaxID=559307 RepID=C5DP93_ZYGRC|nr:uncharacterized protein ZYRO0A01452g [Zygosaccharomyces rouxii]KAH9198976.1 hypothetical protein LQ764DRAFT_144772 [Zygosaccharomyces rouxii]CAR25504.1 ZYRO0A01452p [Zygosaccharomyces rouxii]